ncbi:MAG: bifunctional folylpolyglutamate synthase/dihydrofolate synthase [Cryomorphaceae bacterium]|nr:bifunctional folylpolyglutamate synthase/dihydrofolate synthase [Cryomorphaceae bacterium]
MPNNAYTESLDWLFSQFPSYQTQGASAYKPDLGNIEALCSLLGNPEKSLRFIHVAGTNGKGSVSCMLASILKESGERTGLFTSPHIIDFRERIRINGEVIPEEDVINFCKLIQEISKDLQPSFFEITFAMALWHFKRSKCSICVIETGLGGRLDATNCVMPLVSVITNISLEHTQFLGNTLSAIAREKAGIIKPSIPVVIGECLSESEPVFQEVAMQKNAQLIDCSGLPFSEEYDLPLLGDYQKTNFRTVLQTLEVLKMYDLTCSREAIQSGLSNLHKNTGFFGRMQLIQKEPLILLDVSHNAAGIQQTLDTIHKLNKGKLHLIYGSSSDKDVHSIVKLFPSNASVAFCTFKNLRSLTVEEFEKLNDEFCVKHPIYEDLNMAIEDISLKLDSQDTLLIFGSFFLIADYF